MTTSSSLPTPMPGSILFSGCARNLRNFSIGKMFADRLAPTRPGPVEATLRAILAEFTPGSRPYSTDSYLPDHLVKAAQSALNGNSLAARQHAHNALSTAARHIARGEASQALARPRMAQRHILASMERGAA